MTSRTDTSSVALGATVALAPSPAGLAAPPPAETAAVPPARSPGLAVQFCAAAVLLLLATIAAVLGLASWQTNRIAEDAIRASLRKVPPVVDTYRSDLGLRRLDQVRSVAEAPGTKSLFAGEVNVATRYDFARDTAALLAASTVFLFNQEGDLLARSDRPEGEGVGKSFRGARWVVEPLETAAGATAMIREEDRLSLTASAPVVVGSGDGAAVIGGLAATFALDEDEARTIRDLTGGEVGFLIDMAKRGESPQVAFGVGTKAFAAAELVPRLLAVPGGLSTLFGSVEVLGPVDIEAQGDVRIVVALPITSAAGETLGAVVVARSRAQEAVAFRSIRKALLLIGGLLLLVAFPAAAAMGHRIASPLRELAVSAEAIREGRLDIALPDGGRGEVGVLARAFAALVADLRERNSLEKLLLDLEAQRADGQAKTAPVRDCGVAVERLAAGEVLADRYEIIAMLGRGGMAAVYRAHDRELEEDVALKVLLPDRFAGASGLTEGVERLKQEIRLARRISHPNVVRVHDVGEARGSRFISMECVPGQTLTQILSRQRLLAGEPGLQVIKQLCRGLGAVHAQGIVHRDVKPQNVMVLPNGAVKLMDFGISRLQAPQRSGTGELIISGTPAYMSPEQVEGRRDLDARSDIYSLGIVMFEVFTGSVPFAAPIAMAVLHAHLSASPPRPRDRNPNLSAELEELMLQCVAKAPENRPQSVRLLERRLRDLPAALPVAMPRPGPPHPLAAPARH
ncbi:MAG: protein kinase [Candidatus Schekmanbacteria bacterium]|nr:protein kinase [Candidatus Schekmanbacteria bacterium]